MVIENKLSLNGSNKQKIAYKTATQDKREISRKRAPSTLKQSAPQVQLKHLPLNVLQDAWAG
jgi:hypothetical protein